MDIKVFNRGVAEVIKFDVPYIVISIYSTGSEPAKIPHPPACLDILLIKFDDIKTDKEVYEDIKLESITKEQAEQIWTFVDYYLNREHRRLEPPNEPLPPELILIHCDAGISRSPAVAAAISRVYFGEDDYWFKSYKPNSKVYRTMLEVKGFSNEY